MYYILHNILSDKKDGEIFSCFGVWHLIYMLIIFSAIILSVVLLKNKPQESKSRAINTSISLAFGLYILDFFLMPFAYGEIDLEKLPFHACTAMCVACFLSRHNSFFARFKCEFAILGLASNLIYVIYPAGVMWHAVHPFCYRVVQTLLFHGIMTAYGILTLVFDDTELQWKKIYRDFLLVCTMAAWALLGNTLYNGTLGEYSNKFNWFFVVQDPFYILPQDISPFVAPLITIAAFCLADALIYLAYFTIKKMLDKKQKNHLT